MSSDAPSCPYCGHEWKETQGRKCKLCGMGMGDHYIVYIDADGNRTYLCSVECMALAEEADEQGGE